MLNEGYNDIVLLIEGEEVSSVSSLLCISNDRLKSIIEDDKVEKQILLPYQVTKNAFSLLCNYYGYGLIEINEENVSEVLMCCICLNEMKLLSICEKYVLNHENERIIMGILNLMENIPENYLCTMKLRMNDYISLNCTSFLNNNEILKNLRFENLEYILKIDNLLIPDEKYLLDKILNHYNESIKIIEDKDKKYNEIMKNLNWKKINIYEIDDKYLDLIDLNLIKKSKSENPIKRKYGRIPHTENTILNKMILNGIKDMDKIKEMNCIYYYYYSYYTLLINIMNR